MSSSEYDDILRALDAAQESFERMSLEQKLPDARRERQFDDLRRTTGEALQQAKELARRYRDERHLAGVIEEMHESTTNLLKAINSNAATTNKLLQSSDARLAQVEQLLADDGGGTPFPANAEVLAEGRYLAAQLGGIQGTESPKPLFKNATPTVIPPGLDVLSSSVCTKCQDPFELE